MKLSVAISALVVLGSAAAFAPVAFHATKAPSSALWATNALPRTTGQSQLDPSVIQRYNDLPYPADTVLAEYVWVDAVGVARSKTRTLPLSKVRSDCFF